MHQSLLSNAGLSEDLFVDKFKYYNTVKTGISGAVIKSMVNTMPSQRSFICKALGVTSGNLHRLYKNKVISEVRTETALDILSVYNEAYNLYDDSELANELLQTPMPALNNQKPIELMASFIGRRMVMEALERIKYGDFS